MRGTGFSFLFLLSLAAVSCSNGNITTVSPINGKYTATLDITNSIAPIKLVTDSTRNIVVPEKGTPYNIYELIDTVFFVPLETKGNCLIGEVSKIIADSNSIFVLDKNNGSVLKFDYHGKFLCRFGNRGNGPGEFVKLYDMALDYENKQICLLDLDGGKQIFFSYNGKYIKDVPLYFYYSQLEFGYGKQVAYTGLSSNSHIPAIDDHQLVITNQGQTPLNAGFAYNGKIRNRFHFTSSRPLSSIKGNIFFHHLLSDTIWEIKDTVCHARYVLNIPNNKLGKMHSMPLTDELYKKAVESQLSFTGIYTQTSDVVCFFIANKKRLEPLLYSKVSGKTLYGYAFSEPKKNLFEALKCNYFEFANNDYFIKVIQPYDAIRIVKLNKDIHPDREENLLLKNLDLEDNPILMFAKLKEF